MKNDFYCQRCRIGLKEWGEREVGLRQCRDGREHDWTHYKGNTPSLVV